MARMIEKIVNFDMDASSFDKASLARLEPLRNKQIVARFIETKIGWIGHYSDSVPPHKHVEEQSRFKPHKIIGSTNFTLVR